MSRPAQREWHFYVSDMIGTRNRLIHGYLGLDNEIIWDIIEHEIPLLIEQLRSLKKDADESRIRC